MNKKDLDILLSKFYNGGTTLDEEHELRNALAGDDADAVLMRALDQIGDEVEVPSDLEASLSGKIDEWETTEQSEQKGHRKAKVAPLFWKPTAWAVAASVAVIAAVGWWLTHNNSQQLPGGDNPPVIAKVEKPAQDAKVQTVEPESDGMLPEMPSQPQPKRKPQLNAKSASTYKNNVEHLAQASEMQNDEQLSASDEEIALAALEKFSTVLNKGMDQLDNANEKINDINNTIQQHLI